MSGKGAFRTDATGRTSTRRKDVKVLTDVGPQFIMHARTMRESVGFRWLSWQARKLLDRLELEHVRQGGMKNGQLAVSYSQFVQAGISENCIPRAIQECMAAGFLERTAAGGKSVGDYRPASRYSLTYFDVNGVLTHSWFHLKSIEKIEARFEKIQREWKDANPPRMRRSADHEKKADRKAS